MFSSSLSNLEEIYVKTASGKMVPVSNLVKIVRQTEPTTLSSFNRNRYPSHDRYPACARLRSMITIKREKGK